MPALPSRRDHPRIRGEHAAVELASSVCAGSSPHTRGAPPGVNLRGVSFRIIPAYAGSTSRSSGRSSLAGDHPRIRGEHFRHAQSADRRLGSSPHTRGAHHEGAPEDMGGRIIPAYAGSTPPRNEQTRKSSDHPRIRGEHYDFDVWCWNSCGSSPHTRGAPAEGELLRAQAGIIPAYAGSTQRVQSSGPAPWDHPRIRGEHSRFVGRRDPGGRIIPAYAGSTLAHPPLEGLRADHPRIRGEHGAPDWFGREHPGSSPHTRGAPLSSRS